MSEELKANNYTKSGDKFGEFDFYNIGKTNLSELKKYKIIPDRDYGLYKNTMPDGVLVDRRNKKDINVIAILEFKNFDSFDTIQKKRSAVEQCNTYCQLTSANFGIVTDTKDFIYVNPLGVDIEYKDEKGKTRKYSVITNEDGYDLSVIFPINTDDKVEIDKALKLIKRIQTSLSELNSQLIQEKKINPKNLARSVWQSIWLASGENPDKCLSTFIEIFIFRFLSDLGILKENDNGVPVSFDDLIKLDKNKSLKYYFTNVRGYIKELFPEGKFDNTSIINGFVLEPDILEHNALFSSILNSFDKFLKDEKGNSIKLNNIEPEFKSKIYEDFLKKSISQKNWGQFFTPRSIVKAIIEMSGIESLSDGSVVGDPACGVGGFLLEPILSRRSSDYTIKNSELVSKLIYKGDDRDPKVIILAKANMLIHLSDILLDNSSITKNISAKINTTFSSYHSSILGSLTNCSKDEFDLILSNPPYVTKGVSNYKDAIKDDGKLSDYYNVNGMGVESFFIEKIVNSLKIKGKAFIVIPNGILDRVHERKLRTFIKKHCFIHAIISLPIGAFYSTLTKTYILIIEKKENSKW
jgi:type I restriction enzyme M protein